MAWIAPVALGVCQERDDGRAAASSVVEEIEGGFETFITAKDNKARESGLRRACGAANSWLKANAATLGKQAEQEVFAVAKVVSLATSMAGGWIDAKSVDRFQSTWFNALRTSDRRGILGPLYVKHLVERAAFLYRHLSARAAVKLLSESEIDAVRLSESSDAVATLLSIRADARRLLGDLGGALRDITRALDVADESSRSSVQLVALAIEIDLGRLDRARMFRDEVADGAEGFPPSSPRDLNKSIATLRWFNAAGMHADAGREARRAMALLEPIQRPTVAQRRALVSLRVAGALADAMQAADPGEVDTALEALSDLAANRNVDATSRVAIRLEMAELLTRRRGETDALTALSEIQSALSAIDESLTSSVLLRARSLAQLHSIARRLDDRPRQLEIGRALEGSFEQLVDVWRNIELQEGGVGFLEFAARREVLSEVIESRLAVGVDAAFESVLQVDACGTLSRQLARMTGAQPAPLTVDDVRRIGDLHGVRIIYLVPTESQTHRFDIEDGKIEHSRRDRADVLRRDVSTVRKYVRTRPNDAISGPDGSVLLAMHALFDQFYGDHPLPEAGCWIVTIEGLGPAPLVARPEGTPTAVGLQVPITVLPSLNAAVRVGQLRADDPAARPKLSFYSLQGPRAGRDDIGLTDDEILELRMSRFRTNYVGHKAATVAGFESTLTSSADLFVAWTHGLLDYNSLRPARLIVSDGHENRVRYVDSQFIEDALSEHPTRSAPRVAFIASCRVGQGQKRAGDGAVSNLGGAFLGQGVPAVVVATADLDRDATFDLVRSFATSFLENGNTAARAMLDARRAVASHERFRHPHFWALPELIGWSPIEARQE